jgi:excisionase family DNA binding protein
LIFDLKLEVPVRGYFTTIEAAEYLHLATDTLANWRARKVGPAYIKFGMGRVRYERVALDRWMHERQVTHQSTEVS